MSEEKKSFTVKDRRHFTAEGLTREGPPQAVTPPSASPAVDADPPARPAAEEAGSDAGYAADFAGFLLSLAAQASLRLDPAGAAGQGGLDEARHFISLFEMLRDKTEGRRTAQEEQILQGILYELRVAFLARSRSVGA